MFQQNPVLSLLCEKRTSLSFIINSLLSGSFLINLSSLSAPTKIEELTAGSIRRKILGSIPGGAALCFLVWSGCQFFYLCRRQYKGNNERTKNKEIIYKDLSVRSCAESACAQCACVINVRVTSLSELKEKRI